VNHWECPKWFPCLWYIRSKPCTYLELRLILSPHKPNQDSTWPTSPRCTIGCAPNGFHACGTFSANRAPILRRDLHYLQMDHNELPLHPRHLGVQSVHQNDFRAYGTFGANYAPILRRDWHYTQKDWNELPLDLRHPGEPSGCAQSDFRTYGTFGANCAPILHQEKHYLQIDQNKIPLDPRHLGVPLGVPKMISMAIVHSA
jgi:hypothetical protein